ncbi:SDR family NAD(P)-dependent oxidoreductase [Gordonia otitidis]|uniref:Oxidoreductase n=1 Tax=Gordonia otitidis (strain DSM 44809 / CCUG 52243 / JCM 12355 / NBRC 100426 / IFM 10032) TaxID=1108044 RepID=H5TLM8_GORO1|nr:SDR family oxidoreductase [Gordonia otitidis]GAB34386.1 putative oxidoreductase [Gordonia otitidis NBRC 100426]
MSALRGRTALVSGGGSGLGAAITRELVDNGVRVVVVGRTRETLDALVAEYPQQVHAAVCDVSDPESVAELRRDLAAEDVSILINNAGIAGPVADLVDVDPSAWDEVFAVNVRGTYLMCRQFLPAMVRRKAGDVVNIASVSGKRPLPGRTPYCASKMAVLGLTATLSTEVGPSGVSVNSLSPGPIDSARMHRNFTLEAERTGSTYAEAEAIFVSRSALKRMVTEQEVAGAVVAILSMSGMCGADVDLSAGMVAR